MGLEDLYYYLGVLFLMLLGVIMCDELNDRFKRLPFGPVRIPIIGNLLQLFYYNRSYSYKALTRLAKNHGNTMKLWFGLVSAVVVSGFERINDVIRNDDWVGEQDGAWVLDRTVKSKDGRPSTATQNADIIRMWASARVYANQVLKDYGFGKYSTADTVLQNKCSDLRGLIQYWKDNNKGRIEVTKNFFLPYVLGINWTFITGEMASVEETPILQQLLKLIKRWEELTIKTSKYLDNWPSLCEFLPVKHDFKSLSEVNDEIRTLLQNYIQQCRIKGDYKKTPKNLVDKFLEKIDEREQTPDKKESVIVFSDNALISVLFNLLFPSTLVLQSSLNFACYSLSQLQDVQGRLREERRKVKVTPSSGLSMTEFARMPYLTSFLLEVYRLGNVIPIEKRKLLKTIRESDTRVTKGMTLVINYDSANFDEATWKEPSTFNPNRFLDSSGNIVDEHKLLALVAAKRLCIGEMVARPVLLHSLSALVQQFSFASETKGGISTGLSKPEWGIINNPSSYQLKINESY